MNALAPAGLWLLHAALGLLLGAALFASLRVLTERLLRGAIGPPGWLAWQAVRVGALLATGFVSARQGAGALLALAAGLWIGRAGVLAAARCSAPGARSPAGRLEGGSR
jgi:hypothetical protein